MEPPVTYRRKVRYSDSDAQSIVFNANYLTYFDDAITDYFDALGPEALGGREILLRRAELDFHSPARFGDVLLTSPVVTRIGTTSLIFAMTVVKEATGETVVSGTLVQVVADHENYRPTPVPDSLVDAITRLQGDTPDRGSRPT